MISVDMESEYVAPRPPLSLAAHAAMNVGDVVEVEITPEDSREE
jgi:hypothetical protein